MTSQNGHAVVVGGSVAGFAAAGALARHFGRVTVVERDRYPDRPAFRKGVPQGRHGHGLLCGGLDALERLFPGFKADMIAAGAIPADLPRDFLWLTPAGWWSRFASPHRLLLASRDLIDWSLRRQVEAIDHVVVRQGTDVVGLLAGGTGEGVAGVRARPRGGGEVVEITADLVVVASGRATKAPDWLDALGYGRPAQTRIDAGLGYASRYYAVPREFSGDWRAVFLMPDPPEMLRGGILQSVEGSRWLLTLGGSAGDHPPTDEGGFLAFARSLRHSIIYEAIKDAEPLTRIHGFPHTANQRWHYEAMTRWPERLIVLGDAACAFNPASAQGMSVAAMTAVALDRWLDQPAGEPDGCAGFQQQVAAGNQGPWTMVVGADLRMETTTGARADGQTKFLHRYMDRLVAVTTVDPVVSAVFGDAMTLRAPATSLFSHAVMERVARGPQVPPHAEPPTLTEAVAAVA